MAFHYAGLVSWEETEIDKVAKGKEVLWISEQLYEKKQDGTYVYEDNTVEALARKFFTLMVENKHKSMRRVANDNKS